MNAPRHKAKYFVGPSGWSYPDWNGIVYPSAAGVRFDPLHWVTRYFNAVEVNSSFYRPPTARTAESWVRRAEHAPEFLFTFKLFQAFTHRRAEYGRAEIAECKAGLAPIAASGRLGCLLLQFPWSFRCGPAAFEWLARLRDDFGEFPLAVEVRHTSWDRPDARDRLRDLRLNYCNIDQPVWNQCLRPSAHVTGAVGYVRFHGRRTDTWFAENADTHARYDYLYRPAELEEWIPRLRQIAEQTEQTFVFMNNCARGQSIANGLQIRALLEHRPVDVPPEALRAFPFLGEIASPRRPPPPPEEPTLFDP